MTYARIAFSILTLQIGHYRNDCAQDIQLTNAHTEQRLRLQHYLNKSYIFFHPVVHVFELSLTEMFLNETITCFQVEKITCIFTRCYSNGCMNSKFSFKA